MGRRCFCADRPEGRPQPQHASASPTHLARAKGKRTLPCSAGRRVALPLRNGTRSAKRHLRGQAGPHRVLRGAVGPQECRTIQPGLSTTGHLPFASWIAFLWMSSDCACAATGRPPLAPNAGECDARAVHCTALGSPQPLLRRAHCVRTVLPSTAWLCRGLLDVRATVRHSCELNAGSHTVVVLGTIRHSSRSHGLY